MGRLSSDAVTGRPSSSATTPGFDARVIGWEVGRRSRPRVGTAPPGRRHRARGGVNHGSHARAPGREPGPAVRPAGAGACTGAVATWARRCRVAGAGTLVVLGLLAARLGAPPGSSPLAPARRGSDGVPVRVVARPGDSLWSLVVRAAPQRDPRPLVDGLVRTRGGTDLHPGEVVTVRP